MEVIPGEVIIDAPRTPPPGKSQPIESIAKPEPLLDDAAVRQAIVQAEANNQDPQSITMDDFAKGQVSNPAPAVKPPLEVPQKFLKSDGEVDVEKIQASTRQLDEAIQNREPVPQKTVEDYLTEYQAKEKLFRSGTVPKQAEVQAAPPPPVMSQQQQDFETIVRRDFEADQLGTMTRLMNYMLEQKFQPIAEREKTETTRSNLQKLAEKDSRILREDVFAAVNAKLQADPDLWKLKNPHKAAWLEVKEEMRLGDLPQGSQAQPSRSSPVLGGGTPPSAPSTSVVSPQNVVANLHTLDLRDKRQEELGDEAIRAQLMGHR